ncbi:AMP-binding protein [Aestuariirhabdus litorea]|uniref:AMP-dependent synthetase n=1 Tax=Aestuariirhabdus litorea TaxID=2528527 RepID=A0A3P3VNV5_9GAMM|nr:AMP-binding protein [Aestuariirhabdus litorea]RRJ84441.1 AMP-dependent synthetase [Aestuariirhabdus litorea]RWW97665.1 AMP-dependent synthetase [Endozoicomonadaceae bacterium GTF-13]
MSQAVVETGEGQSEPLQSYKTPLEMFYHWERSCPDRVYLRQSTGEGFRELSWKEVGQQARTMASALKDKGFEPGARIALLSKNCAEWLIADLAIMLAGYVSVPLYPSQHADTIAYTLHHCDARAIFVGRLDDWDSMEAGIPGTLIRIALPYETMPADHQWDDLLRLYEPMEASPLPDSDELMTIVYTSGTTGNPKGVMHSFGNFGFACTHAVSFLPLKQSDHFFSFLPLSHIAERFFVEGNSLYAGAQVSFPASLESFAQDLVAVQPTIFFAVPRLWTKFQLGVLQKLPQARLNRLLRIPILGSLVARKIRTQLGLSRARVVVSGAAPIAMALLDWYQRIGIRISEGYGMTENMAYGVINLPKRYRRGTLGHIQVMPHNEVKISAQGEILFRSRALMLGYYLDREKTDEVLQGGFYHTGDQGEIDADGFLRITGRIKDSFKTSKGKFVSPAPIESLISENELVEQVCLVGRSLAQPVAVVELSEMGNQQPRATVEAQLEKTRQAVNRRVEHHEQTDALLIAADPWTIENGMMTPTLKIKRNRVEEVYQSWIESPRTGTVEWESP